jgi:sterol desaturase/sphingolipid hydroxylase (fatty acid hydroxylase superfamily)
MNSALFVMTFVSTYYAASLVQTVFHRLFGHSPRIVKVHTAHVRGHHAQYSKVLLSERWIPTEQHVTWYYAIPFTPMVIAAWWMLPFNLFIIHILGLAFAIWWHVYLHRQYHIRNVWWERFAWFQRKRRLHFLHHQKSHKNYAIVEYFWDRLFRTLEDQSIDS